MPELEQSRPRDDRNANRDVGSSITIQSDLERFKNHLISIASRQEITKLEPSDLELLETVGLVKVIGEEELKLEDLRNREISEIKSSIEKIDLENSFLKAKEEELHRIELNLFHGITLGVFCNSTTAARREAGLKILENFTELLALSDKLEKIADTLPKLKSNLGYVLVNPGAEEKARALIVQLADASVYETLKIVLFYPNAHTALNLTLKLLVGLDSAEHREKLLKVAASDQALLNSFADSKVFLGWKLGSANVEELKDAVSKYPDPQKALEIALKCMLDIEQSSAIYRRLLLVILLEPDVFNSFVSDDVFQKWLALENARQLHIKYLSASNSQEKQLHLDKLAVVAVPDSPPYFTAEERHVALMQTYSIQTRCLSYALHFSRMMMETRRFPDGDLPLLAQFFSEAASKSYAIHSKGRAYYPGGGFAANGIRLEKLLYADVDKPVDPYHLYKSTFPDYGESLLRLDKFRMAFVRAKIILSHPDCEHSLIIENEHFTSSPVVSVLVPNEAIWPYVEECSSNLLDYSFKDRAMDFNTHQKYLIDLLSRRTAHNILTLDSPSCIFGSLSNSYAPAASGYTKDLWGHPHKSYYLKGEKDQVELNTKLFQSRHENTYKQSKFLLDCLDMTMITYGLWKANATKGSPETPRMLDAIYKWGASKDLSGLQIVTASPVRWDSQPITLLDGKEFCLTPDGETQIPLPWSEDGPPEAAKRLWKEHAESRFIQNGLIDMEQSLYLLSV